MPAPRPRDQQAFNRWIDISLRERHDAVALEPLPDSLLKLLQDGERH
jgi:hypothetical protein